MKPITGNTFQNFEGGNLSRRQLLQGLALGAVTAGIPLSAAKNESWKLKAAWVNHYTYSTPDVKKTSDWYAEVFGMELAHQSEKEAHLWYGDTGGDTLMIVKKAPAGEMTKIIDFAFTIEDWDKKAVEADLKKRGLNPVADTGKSFKFKDMEGFPIAVCAKDYMKRPKSTAATKSVWKTLSANHIVELSPDYGKLRDWYKDLLDLRVTHDSGRDVYMWLGDTVWIPTQRREGAKTSAELGSLDHVAYTIADFNKEKVEAELKMRDLKPRLDTDLSFNCVDINGFKTQVCDKQLVPLAEKRPPRPPGQTKQ